MDHPSVKTGFEKILDSHGYGFQYSVLNLAHDLTCKGISRWIIESVEFPVEVQGAGTRIDFILRLDGTNLPTFLLAECKKANPALSDWCFARAPYIQKDRSREYAILEYLEIDDTAQVHASSLENWSSPEQRDAYHIVLWKSNLKRKERLLVVLGEAQSRKQRLKSVED